LGDSIRTDENGIVTRITENIMRLQERVQNAADLAGRDFRSVTVVAVSKKHPVSAIREARAAGLDRFGENYVQEALPKIADIEPPVEWHFIGKTQSNKAAAIAEAFDWVHTLTTEKMARRLSARRPPERGELQVCIQLRPTGAEDRAGVAEDAVANLAERVEDLPGLCLRGLMMMPLPGLDADGQRREFARTRKLLERLTGDGHDLDTLSMGMSADLEMAIMEGSTMIRVGTDIFGPREYD
jgi:pyridoxal phosphate enzyme (YggS family)